MDQGSVISDSIGMCQAKLHTPVFTKGKKQLSAVEIEETRSIANIMYASMLRALFVVLDKSILFCKIPFQFTFWRRVTLMDNVLLIE